MKACIYDNTDDPSNVNHNYYDSSLALEHAWKSADNLCEASYKTGPPGGECKIWSFSKIITCLDNNTSRLLPNGPIPPTPKESCFQAADEVCPDLMGTGSPCLSCLAEMKYNPVLSVPCSEQHISFKILEEEYCGLAPQATN